MKKFIPFLAVFFLLHFSPVLAQDNIWTGNVSSSWDNAGNWSLGSVPTSASTVTIKSVSNKPYPELSQNVSIARLNMEGGASLTIGSHELNVEYVWVTSAKIYSNSGTIRTPMLRLWTWMNFYGKLTLIADNGVGGGNTFHDDLTVYANPHVPAGQTAGSCWPCGGLYFSYSNADTFKGNIHVIHEGVGNLHFGIFPGNIVFEKKARFQGTGTNGLRLGFLQHGGTATFKDSVEFAITSNYIQLRGVMEFQKPVTFNQSGGDALVINWAEYPALTNKASLVTFKDNVVLNKSGGGLGLGSWNGTVASGSILEVASTLLAGTQGFTGGSLYLTNSTLHSPNTQLLASTHPTTLVTGSSISFDNSTIHGKIHVKADHIDAKTTVFNGKTILNKDGWAANATSNGGNTFYGPTELINSAGYDWNTGVNLADTYKDSLRISLSGTGQLQRAGSNRGANFKVGMANGNRFEGPVKIETPTTLSGDVLISSTGSTDIFGTMDISGFNSGSLNFYNSKFRGTSVSRTLSATQEGMKLILNNCLFEGPVSFQVPRFRSDATIFMQPTLIQKTHGGDDDSIGGNTFHKKVQFITSAGAGKIQLLCGEDKVIK